MPLFTKLATPSFDLCWLNTILKTKQTDAATKTPKKSLLASSPYILIPGGGGSSRTGVKNIIQVVSLPNPDSKELFEFKQSIKTDTIEKSYLCSAITSGVIDDYSIICAAADTTCILFSVEIDNDGQLITTRQLEFQADVLQSRNSEGCVNCCIVTPTGDIITAGDDGIIRVWTIETTRSHSNQKSSSETGTANDQLPNDRNGHHGNWGATLTVELTGHEGPIMSLSIHPSEPLLISGSKDGTLRLWSLLTYRLEDVVRCSDGICGGSFATTTTAGATLTKPTPAINATSTPLKNGSVTPTSNKSGVPALALNKISAPSSAVKATPSNTPTTATQIPLTIECRGCRFSSDGSEVLAIQSGKRGAAHLVKWKLRATVLDSNQPTTYSITPGYSDDNDNDNNREELRLRLCPVAALQVSKVPCTRLCLSSSGQTAAVGSSDGSIIFIHHVDEEKMVLGKVHPCHQLPVTGLCFAPPAILNQSYKYTEMVMSCSADYTLAMNATYTSSFGITNKLTGSICFQIVFILFSFMLLLLLFTSAFVLFVSSHHPQVSR